MPEKKEAHIVYTGIVQGVGFRYTVQRLALDIGLTGWVKNLRDGRVEMLVEGDPKGLEQLMQNIENHFTGYIRNKEIEYQTYSGKFKDFQITY